MSARDTILSRVRSALGPSASGSDRAAVVANRLAEAPAGVIPARGQLAPDARLDLFCEMAEKVSASVERVASHADVPAAVSAYLRSKNLPASIRMGADTRLAAAPWAAQASLEVRSGPSDGTDETGVSHAFAGIAETGTLVLHSGPDNPTTINFLPEHHIVVVDAADVAGDLESALTRVRETFGKGEMPRTVNLVTGPSRSGDVEQKIILGAHGPRALHLIVVEGR